MATTLMKTLKKLLENDDHIVVIKNGNDIDNYNDDNDTIRVFGGTARISGFTFSVRSPASHFL